MEEIKDLNKWRESSYSSVARINMAKTSILSNLIYKFNEIQIKPPSYLADIDKKILTFTQKRKRSRIANTLDTWVAQVVEHLPSAQVMIPQSWDEVPSQAPCSEGSLLLPLPSALSACDIPSLCSLCQINNIFLKSF